MPRVVYTCKLVSLIYSRSPRLSPALPSPFLSSPFFLTFTAAFCLILLALGLLGCWVRPRRTDRTAGNAQRRASKELSSLAPLPAQGQGLPIPRAKRSAYCTAANLSGSQRHQKTPPPQDHKKESRGHQRSKIRTRQARGTRADE